LDFGHERVVQGGGEGALRVGRDGRGGEGGSGELVEVSGRFRFGGGAGRSGGSGGWVALRFRGRFPVAAAAACFASASSPVARMAPWMGGGRGKRRRGCFRRTSMFGSSFHRAVGTSLKLSWNEIEKVSICKQEGFKLLNIYFYNHSLPLLF